MSEIRVPVTVPGAQRAAQELRGVQQAALGVGKAEEAAARGADKLAQANKRLAESSKLAARGFQAAGRFGGMAGGVLGRIGGGLGSAGLGAMGPLAAGAAVAGFALMKLADISNHNVERATALAKAMADATNAVRAGEQQAGKNRMADFRENEQTMRAIIANGMPLDRVQKLSAMGYKDAPEAMAKLSGYSDSENASTALATAMALKRMGVTGGLMEGLGSLPEDRVANARGMGGDAVVTLLREVISAARDGAPVSDAMLTGMFDRTRSRGLGSADMRALDLNARAEGGARGARFAGAVDPAAATAILNDRVAWAEPISAAFIEIGRQQDQAIEAMKAAADAENSVMAFLKDTFMPGGNFETQLRRAMNDRAKVVNGTSY